MNPILTQTFAQQRAEALRAEAQARRDARLLTPVRPARVGFRLRALLVRLRPA